MLRKIIDFKPFVPSNDFEISKSFYHPMGFKINWDGDEIFEVNTNFGLRFLLMPNNHNNFAVNSVQAWYEFFTEIKLAKTFSGTKVAPPELRS